MSVLNLVPVAEMSVPKADVPKTGVYKTGIHKADKEETPSQVSIEAFLSLEAGMESALKKLWDTHYSKLVARVRALVAQNDFDGAEKAIRSFSLPVKKLRPRYRFLARALGLFGASRITPDLKKIDSIKGDTYAFYRDRLFDAMVQGIESSVESSKTAWLQLIAQWRDQVSGQEPHQEPNQEPRSVKKADRAVSPLKDFVSFERIGDKGWTSLQIQSSLHSSRLASLGFLLEAEAVGVDRYIINEQLDSRICPVCRVMHNKEFSVSSARSVIDRVVYATDPGSIKNIQPWPDQSLDSVKRLARMSPEELQAENIVAPPFHPRCYAEGTKVYTDHGWLDFREVSIARHRFLSLNPETGLLEWVNATRFVYYQTDRLVRVSCKYGDLMLVTPDHEMVYWDVSLSDDMFVTLGSLEDLGQVGEDARFLVHNLDNVDRLASNPKALVYGDVDYVPVTVELIECKDGPVSVFDVTLEKNHTLLVSYNGMAVWGSNCRGLLDKVGAAVDIQSTPSYMAADVARYQPVPEDFLALGLPVDRGFLSLWERIFSISPRDLFYIFMGRPVNKTLLEAAGLKVLSKDTENPTLQFDAGVGKVSYRAKINLGSKETILRFEEPGDLTTDDLAAMSKHLLDVGAGLSVSGMEHLVFDKVPAGFIKFGFLPHDWDALRDRLKTRLARMRGKIPQKVFDLVSQILENPDPKAAWVLLDLKPVINKTPIGDALIRSLSTRVYLPLLDKDALTRFAYSFGRS